MVILLHWERMLKRHPRFLEIHCTRGCRRQFHLTALVAFEGWSSVRDRTNRENTVRHTKYGRIRGMVVGEDGRLTGVYCTPVCHDRPIMLQITVKKKFVENLPFFYQFCWIVIHSRRFPTFQRSYCCIYFPRITGMLSSSLSVCGRWFSI